jgi:hypothetical protein
MHDITQLGKGAKRAPADQATPKFRHAFAALPPVDWTVPFSCPEPISNDQNGSSSCVAQAWSYYHEQLRPEKRFSRRDIYAQISLGFGQGAYIYDGHEFIINKGQATRDEVPDPAPETEAGMLDKTGITAAKEASDKELAGLTVSLDINQWAAAIRACKGIVGGLEGTNAGWADLANPTPPAPNSAEWGHALYFFGYHLHDGRKCVIAKSSWGTAGNTTVHHIKENYFKSGFMFNAYTLAPKEIVMQNQTKIVLGKDGKTVYKAIPVATDFENFKKQASVEGIEVPNPIPPATSL